MSKTMKQIIIEAYQQDIDCGHQHPPFVKSCRNCVANTIEREVRFWLAQDLRLVLEIALDGVTDKPTIDSTTFKAGAMQSPTSIPVDRRSSTSSAMFSLVGS